MEKELTIKQLIKRTYLKIMWQFLLCLILFYIVPTLLSSVSGINEKNANHFALFFSVSSWIYLCIILILIIVTNIRQLLTKIQKEMNMVYHSGLYFTKNEHHHLQIKEFIETNDLIERMQSDIKNRIENEKEYIGRGVSACATCDGFFYRKKVVAVVGGGDTACEEAIYLSGLASKVYMIVRKDYLRASDVMRQRVMQNEKIEVLFEHNAEGLYGEDGVEGVHLVKRLGEADETHYDLPIDGFFLAIGHNPNSKVFSHAIETDEQGFIKTQGNTPKTNVEGVFAAGDVADNTYRQAVVAAGSGCKAAMEAERYLTTINK